MVTSPLGELPEHHVPSPDEPALPELEDDETVAPRPEEEIADALRAEPDVADHRASSHHGEGGAPGH